MRVEPILILDTHIWIWWIEQDDRLPNRLQQLIRDFDGTVAISAASVYEMTLLAQRQRIKLSLDIDDWIRHATQDVDIDILPVNATIAQSAGCLPLHHGDPLDRIIIASALHHDAILASRDGRFPDYDVLKERLITGKD
ncbi:MAG: type II toxin-antitoxin system VapC family toxin [Pseudomonadota bacterium]